MRVSLFYNGDVLPGTPGPALYQEIEAQAIVADRVGLAGIWLAEHHFALYGRLPAPLLLLARLSAVTHQLALGTAVVEAPYYHPLRLAEDAALVDRLSHGRLRLGIGSGGRNKPTEFAHFGVALEEKTARTLEIVAILRQAFDAGVVDFAGRYYRLEGIELAPRSVQRGQQLIWLAASEATPEVAGAAGYGLLIPRVGPRERHRELIARYRAALQGTPGNVAQLRMVYVAESEREAHAQVRAMVARYAQYDLGVTWDGQVGTAAYQELLRRLNAVIGTPEQVGEQLVAWQAADGFDEIICQVYGAGMQHVDALRCIELLGQVVVPRLQDG